MFFFSFFFCLILSDNRTAEKQMRVVDACFWPLPLPQFGIYGMIRCHMFNGARLCTVLYVISSTLKSDCICIGSQCSEARIGVI